MTGKTCQKAVLAMIFIGCVPPFTQNWIKQKIVIFAIKYLTKD